jgi:hypothetical protein
MLTLECPELVYVAHPTRPDELCLIGWRWPEHDQFSTQVAY